MLLNVPDYQPILQNEEHFVVETPAADASSPAMKCIAVPTHICPTCAMHQQAYVVEEAACRETWDIAARDRVLTV